jgi:hypothetical protein
MPTRPPVTAGRSNGRSACGGRGRGNPNKKPQAPNKAVSTKFKGNCNKLQGFVFDCSDYKQADTFVTTLKRFSEYIGAKYKHGGDIRSSLINKTKAVLTLPTAPVIVNPAALTAGETVLQMIFKGEIDAFIKRRGILDNNIQKAYSLISGQCTNLLQSKLKQQANWAVISVAQDAIQLVILIKLITFKFEDQKFLPLALYQAKANLYNLRQGNMTNHGYLQRFNNLIDVATTYNGQLYDGAIVDIVTDRLHCGVLFAARTADQKAEVENQSNELYLATMFYISE